MAIRLTKDEVVTLVHTLRDAALIVDYAPIFKTYPNWKVTFTFLHFLTFLSFFD